jgi:phage-related baseplate assembly protein
MFAADQTTGTIAAVVIGTCVVVAVVVAIVMYFKNEAFRTQVQEALESLSGTGPKRARNQIRTVSKDEHARDEAR